MSLREAVYRVFRLRRLIVVSLLLPVAVVAVIAQFKGASAFALLALAVTAPLAHALRYPNAWMETLAVSLVTAGLLALAGTIGPDIGLLGLGVRILGLALLGAILFLILSSLLPLILMSGTPRERTFRVSGRSRLAPEGLADAITLYPGRTDEYVTCSNADADGAFQVTLHHRIADCSADEPMPFDIELFAQVLTATPEVHEVMTVEAPPEVDEIHSATEDGDTGPSDDVEPEVTITRYEFRKTWRGTRVEMAETGARMPWGMALGFWLQDYMADYLTDEIDRAEGKPPRALRWQVQDQLIVDVARRFSRSAPPEHPAE